MKIIIKKENEELDYANIINEAISSCSNNGGGCVYISKGIYKTSTIIFKSNVELQLEEDARIVLHDDLKRFKTIDRHRDESISRPTWENCDYDGMTTTYFISEKEKRAIISYLISIKSINTVILPDQNFFMKLQKSLVFMYHLYIKLFIRMMEPLKELTGYMMIYLKR